MRRHTISGARRLVVVATTALLLAAVVSAPDARADGGGRAETLVAGSGSIWTTGENALVRIDPRSGRIAAHAPTVPSDVIPALAVGEGAVWQLSGRVVRRIDPGAGGAGLRVLLPEMSAAIAAGAGGVWVAGYDDGVLRELDPRDGRVRRSIHGVGLHVEAIVATRSAIWIASIGPWTTDRHGQFTPDGAGTVTRVDPQSGRVVARLHVGRGPGALAIGPGSLWVSNFRGLRASFSVTRIDTARNRVTATLPLHRLLGGVAVGAGYVWVVNPGRLVEGGLDMSGGTLVRIDPRSERVVVRSLPDSSRPAAVAFARGSLWIASPGNSEVLRLDPTTLREARIRIS